MLCVAWWCSSEAAQDGSVSANSARHRGPGAAWSRQSRSALLPSLLHLRRSRSWTVRPSRWALLSLFSCANNIVHCRYRAFIIRRSLPGRLKGSKNWSDASPDVSLPVCPSLCLCFNDHFFSGGPGLAGIRMPPFWILLELRMAEIVMKTGAVKSTKFQSHVTSSPPTT